MSDLELTMMRRVGELKAENARLKAEVERLTNQNALATPRHLIASQDIKTLREQIEELKLENSQYEEHHKYGQNVITSLREEVERLTKAGDAMAAHIKRNDERCYIVLPDGDIRISEWNAAKEGKQP
jgi:chromosome segregation ATPase